MFGYAIARKIHSKSMEDNLHKINVRAIFLNCSYNMFGSDIINMQRYTVAEVSQWICM